MYCSQVVDGHVSLKSNLQPKKALYSRALYLVRQITSAENCTLSLQAVSFAMQTVSGNFCLANLAEASVSTAT